MSDGHERAMRLAIIVSEFPKATETFTMREVMQYHGAGHQVRIYHLRHFNNDELVHDFARPALGWARSWNYLLDATVLTALARTVILRPRRLLGILGNLIRQQWREPMQLAKSLAILPKSLAIAKDLQDWRVDHIHATFAGLPATAAWIVHRITGLPYSVSCHAHDIFISQSMLGPKLLAASFVRPISRFNRDFLLSHLPRLDKQSLKVIHCGIDTAEMRPIPRQPDDVFRILYVGSLEIRKGVDHLCKALALGMSDANWECLIVGSGPMMQELRRLTDELGLGDRIRFLGGRQHEEIIPLYEQVDLQVVPSIVGPGGRTEGIPTVIMEAMAVQRPVVASELSGVPELLHHGKSGILVPPGDIEALAKAIRQVKDDPEWAAGLALAGRQMVEREFDLVKNATSLMQQFAAHKTAWEADS